MKALKRRHMAILLFALYLAAVAYLCFLKPGSIPVLRDENGILLVHGIALDQRAVPTPGEKALKITFEK